MRKAGEFKMGQSWESWSRGDDLTEEALVKDEKCNVVCGLTSGRCAFKSEATYDAIRELLQRNGANMHRDHVKVLEDALKDREGCLACEKQNKEV